MDVATLGSSSAKAPLDDPTDHQPHPASAAQSLRSSVESLSFQKMDKRYAQADVCERKEKMNIS